QLDDESRQSIAGQQIKLAGLELPAGLDDRTRGSVENARSLAFVSGFRIVTVICGALALISGLTAWVMIGNAPRAET
ncbi:MAG TPA: MFS transporter, partial [Blastocatellia bacterium]|nr:MFS transporter [Blastocatellia bacterium]